MKRYILSSPVVNASSVYTYQLITVEKAREWLGSGPVTSLLEPETAMALDKLAGAPVPAATAEGHAMSEVEIQLEPLTDTALVFRLILPAEHPHLSELTPEFIANNCEIGLQSRLM